MNTPQFDAARDAAIRTVLRETVSASVGARPWRRFLVGLVIVLGGLLALGGGGYAFASAHPELFGGDTVAAPPTASAVPRTPAPIGSPLVPTETPVAPTTADGGSSAAAADAPQIPVIDSPAQGQTLSATGSVTISGTGTPGSHVYLAEYCTLAPPACTVPEEFGQPGQPQIVVSDDGRWQTTVTMRPPQTLTFRVAASAAFVSADGTPSGAASGLSPDRTFTVTGSGG